LNVLGFSRTLATEALGQRCRRTDERAKVIGGWVVGSAGQFELCRFRALWDVGASISPDFEGDWSALADGEEVSGGRRSGGASGGGAALVSAWAGDGRLCIRGE
jgi:hypothetical protein